MSKANSPKNQNSNLIHILLLVSLLCIVIVVGIIVSYRAILTRITKISIENMAELVEHDKISTESNIEMKWQTLLGISRHINAQKFKTTDILLEKLSTNALFLDCIVITLVSTDGMTASSNLVLKKDEMMKNLCLESGERFVKQIKSPRSSTQGLATELVYGVKIQEIIVENITYSYIIARLDVDTVQNNMKIDCYNGRGKSRVIDANGAYIVKADRSYTPQIEDNFFANIAEGKFANDWSVERIKSSMQKKQSFSMSWSDDKNKDIIISFVPMQWIDWYFITLVPVDVFIEQGMGLLKVVVIFMTVAIFLIALAVSATLKRTFQMVEAERIHRESLAKALKKADSASRAKTTFLNNVSHDIRTPMNAIIGYTALVKNHATDTNAVYDYLEKIEQSSDYLLSLINDVLDMSRIEAGKISIDAKPENLLDILSNLKNILISDIHTKNLELIVDTTMVVDENVMCDKLHLNQILLNLLSNAMKFTKSGGKIVLGVVEKPSKKAGFAIYEFSVQDTGIGMNPDFISTIFEPFARERTSTVSGIQGTGLGMSITKNIVDLMGGSIKVSSEQGKGSEFIVALEFKLHNEKIEKKQKQYEALSSFDFKGMKLLLVEDNELNREIATEILQEAGFVVDVAKDGLEAVNIMEKATANQYDAILMDIQMPIMNGYEATKKIRQLPNKEVAVIPIIALTANAFEEDKNDALNAGMTSHVEKPIDIPVLLETLKRIRVRS